MSSEGKPYCPECGVSDPWDGCPECGRPCDHEFHGEHREGAEVERLERERDEAYAALERIAAEWRPNSSESPDDWVAWAQSTAISAVRRRIEGME